MENIRYKVIFNDGSVTNIKRNSKAYFDETSKFLLGENIRTHREIHINLEYVISVEINA